MQIESVQMQQPDMQLILFLRQYQENFNISFLGVLPEGSHLVLNPVIPKKVVRPREQALERSLGCRQELGPGRLVSRPFYEDWRQFRAVCRPTVVQPLAG